MSHLLYASPACVLVPSILVARASAIKCFIIIYCSVSFICLLLLGMLAWDLIYSLCSFYVNIFCGHRTEETLLWIYIYIYYTGAGCIIVIVCILVFLCSTHSTVLPLSREPNLGRSVAITGGARPQLNNCVWETSPLEVLRSWAPFKCLATASIGLCLHAVPQCGCKIIHRERKKCLGRLCYTLI